MDSRITAEIIGFVREYQQIEIKLPSGDQGRTQTVNVHPPYMLQSISMVTDGTIRHLQKHHQARLRRVLAARESASPGVKELLAGWFYDQDGKENCLARGRANSDEIRCLLQAAVDRGLVPSSKGEWNPDAVDLRHWLKKYGVGVDCSGFVQQALTRLLALINPGDKQGWLQNSRSEIGFLRCAWVYRNILRTNPRSEPVFTEIQSPSQAKPGDIILTRSHMRLVAEIKRHPGVGLTFTLAESTSAEDIPSGQTALESDIGPRFYTIYYPEPNRSIADQVPRGKREIDTDFKAAPGERDYVIGRYRAFETLRLGG